jgi:hypothetical protein
MLPSEYWLEWSDFWMCHEDERNVLLPEADFGAVQGTLLVGEAALQAHPYDCDAAAFTVIVPPELARCNPSPGVSSDALRVCELRCRRCRTALGTVKLREKVLQPLIDACEGSSSSDGGQPLLSSECSFPLAHLFPAASAAAVSAEMPAAPTPLTSNSVRPARVSLPPRLSKEVDPFLLLWKDALWLPEHQSIRAAVALAHAGEAEPATAVGQPVSPTSGLAVYDKPHSTLIANALRVYTPVTRIAERLLSALLGHGQYSFWVRAAPPARGSLLVVASSWNAKVAFSLGDAGAPTHRAVEDAAVGANGASDRPVPALRVQYHAVGEAEYRAGPGGNDEGALADGAEGPDLLVPAAEWQAVVGALQASTAALPASRRHLRGMQLGYLPLSLAR